MVLVQLARGGGAPAREVPGASVAEVKEEIQVREPPLRGPPLLTQEVLVYLRVPSTGCPPGCGKGGGGGGGGGDVVGERASPGEGGRD